MRVRWESLEGRPHVVAPVVMLVEGVHAGSRGPVLYLAAELRRSAPAWNGSPAVVLHPEVGGIESAAHPLVWDRQKVGAVFGSSFDGRALRAEAWLDVARLEAVSPEVLEDVKAGRVIEVSTGLTFDAEPAEGTWGGRQFAMIARDMRPDHLAILPGLVGACSVAAGCGLLARNESGVLATA